MEKNNGFIECMGFAWKEYSNSLIEQMKLIYQQWAELEAVSGMPVSQIIELFKNGFRFEEPTDMMKEFENQMEMIRLMQENAELRKKNKKLRRNRYFGCAGNDRNGGKQS